MDEPLDILCINCQQMVNSRNISSHSFLCVYPSTNLNLLESSSTLANLQYKLEKLREALEEIIVMRARTEAISFKFLLKKTMDLWGVSEVSTESIETTNSIAAAVRKFARSMIKPGLIIYSERLRELASEKTLALIECLIANGCSEEIMELLNKKYSEISKIKTDASESCDKQRTLRKLSEDLFNIDEIASQISRIMTQRSSTNSMLSPEVEEGEDFDIQDLDNMNQDKIKEDTQQSVEDLHRFFYSKCLMIKLSYNSRHLSQYIQIHELFKAVKELQIPMEKWEDFIKEEFEHPGKWISPALMVGRPNN